MTAGQPVRHRCIDVSPGFGEGGWIRLLNEVFDGH